MKKNMLSLAILLLFAVWGSLHLINESTQSAPITGRTYLSVYTTGQATTPQMPLWKALAEGDLTFTPVVHYWKNLDDLRGTLLAGKGDIWVGHIDGFAQAAMRGAPIRLVSVTGWKKFYILSSRPDIQTFDDIARLPETTEIASAPPHSPGVAVMHALENSGLPRFNYAPHEPKQLALKAMQGKADLLILPEPLVTILLTKNTNLRVVASVEEEYGRLTGSLPILPIAGIAVNTNTLNRHPDLADNLEAAMEKHEEALQAAPESGIAAMPTEFEKFIDPAIVQASLIRDVIRVQPADEAENMIREYLAMLLPESVGTDGTIPLPATFFGREQ